MQMTHYTISIIGAGNVGAALGKGWARAGHNIRYGVTNPVDPKYIATSRTAGGAAVLSVKEAVDGADVIVLAVPWAAVSDALAACGDLENKIIIDATNPLEFGADGLELAIGFTTSGGEEVARLAKSALVFKRLARN